jgi:hypothetical protein
MTGAAEPRDDGQPTVEHAALDAEALADAAAAPGAPALGADATAPPVPPAPVAVSTTGERPELVVGAAFAGGFALALLLKRLAR